MPYFIYQIQEHPESKARLLTHLDTQTNYKEARAKVRGLREEKNDVEGIRMIFAKNETEAQKLLSAPRDERVIGED